jgi:uncharacterized protein YndB with AHSA1/START domain
MPARHEHVDQLFRTDERWELRFTRTLDHPAAGVWQALTEPERLRAWFPFAVEFEGDCAPGAPLRFVSPDGGGETVEGEVVACDRPRRFEFRWGDGEQVRFGVEPIATDSTRLTLVNTIDEVGKAARDAAGWHVALDRLAAHLDGTEPQPSTSERFLELFRDYAGSFGHEASSIEPPASHAGA